MAALRIDPKVVSTTRICGRPPKVVLTLSLNGAAYYPREFFLLEVLWSNVCLGALF